MHNMCICRLYAGR